MKYVTLIALAIVAGCSLSPIATEGNRILTQDLICDVSYPQLPKCECGCAGDICTTGTMGVVVCGTDRAGRSIIVPAAASTFVD